jgi:GxxExxY protein
MLSAKTHIYTSLEQNDNLLTDQIIEAAIEVHRTLGGPGLLESLYEDALFHELHLRNIPVQAQVKVPVNYKNFTLREPMRLDLLVAGRVIIEIKATEMVQAIHKAQLLTYLRLTGLKLGLVLNFGQYRLIDGISRVVNNF